MTAPMFDAVPAVFSPVEVLESAIHGAQTAHDREAYRDSLFLVTHPEVHVSTDADYPWWTPAMGCAQTPAGATEAGAK